MGGVLFLGEPKVLEKAKEAENALFTNKSSFLKKSHELDAFA